MNNNSGITKLRDFELGCINDYMHFILSFYFIFFKDLPGKLNIVKQLLLNLGNKNAFKLNSMNKPNIELLTAKKFGNGSIFTGEITRILLEENKKPSKPANERSPMTLNRLKLSPNISPINSPINTPINSPKMKRKIMKLSLKLNNSANSASESLGNSSRSNEEQWSRLSFSSNNTKKLNKSNNDKESLNSKNNTRDLFSMSSLGSNGEQLPSNSTLNLNTSIFSKKNNSSGAMSTILMSPNGFHLFKQPKNQRNKRAFSNECKVYSHLEQKDPTFVDKCTCFIKCYPNGILLKNGGFSLKQMIESKPPSNFQKLFKNILDLHMLRVVHNDLHCGNIVGDDYRFIDFGLAKICPPRIHIDINFLKNINIFFQNFFNSLVSI